MSRLSSAGVEKVNVVIKNSGRNKTDRYWTKKALVSQETWNRFRTGKIKISFANFVACCKALDLDPNELKEQTFEQPNLSFLGRARAIESLNALAKATRVIVIHGVGGQGKTTLAQKYLQELESNGYQVIELYMPIDVTNIPSAKSVLDEWFNRDFHEMSSSQFTVTLDRLRRILKEQKIAILVDNIESLLDENGKVIPEHSQYLDLFSVLSDHATQSITIVTSRCRLLESRLRSVYNYAIPPLSQSDWQDYFTYSNVLFDEKSLAEMHSKLGGNAKAMTSLCGEIYMDFDRNATNFWEQRGADILTSADLKDLVAGHLEHLKKLEPLAYGLLRRMGCYRYQSIPHIPVEALFYQLWDIPEAEHNKIIEVLKNRSLVELINGEYSLHPLVRAEAVYLLKQNEEEFTKAHNNAADFWKAKVQSLDTDKDLLMAFEPCYHYLETNDLNKIIEIFLNPDLLRDDNLHMAFYGRLSPTLVLELLDKIEDRVLLLPPEQSILILAQAKRFHGSLYFFSGDPKKAVMEFESTIKIIEQINSKQLIPLLLFCVFHAFACKLELGEFDGALVLIQPYVDNIDRYKYTDRPLVRQLFIFQAFACKLELGELDEAIVQTKPYADNIDRYKYTDHPLLRQLFTVYPQLVQSFMLAMKLEHDASVALAEETYEVIINDSLSMSDTSRACACLYLGFVCVMNKRFDQSLKIYNTALQFSRKARYRQLESKAMYGLAEAYRNIGDLTKAKECCLQAKDILIKIEPKLDLAKVLVEEALIAREMREHGCQDNFEKAIALFTELNAPKQVERVRKLMG
ncbi:MULTISPECIES: NACHT domain-containing protein [Pseudanabaena]|uniref:NACHT domain-containing protein n=1 Tax=Pseudanabaena TaxID=1152 RepID=UPI00247A31E6|nr:MULTISPECIES: NACHT domain-containing protein [Pseudanabaena]MEA5488206.1 NACHT domain-containing protein [Pseudanabaena sp. CCNP1317]WGS74753.1 NACHT domain-containing protein [Pseudanabaena galeata CCNP1313]